MRLAARLAAPPWLPAGIPRPAPRPPGIPPMGRAAGLKARCLGGSATSIKKSTCARAHSRVRRGCRLRSPSGAAPDAPRRAPCTHLLGALEAARRRHIVLDLLAVEQQDTPLPRHAELLAEARAERSEGLLRTHLAGDGLPPRREHAHLHPAPPAARGVALPRATAPLDPPSGAPARCCVTTASLYTVAVPAVSPPRTCGGGAFFKSTMAALGHAGGACGTAGGRERVGGVHACAGGVWLGADPGLFAGIRPEDISELVRDLVLRHGGQGDTQRAPGEQAPARQDAQVCENIPALPVTSAGSCATGRPRTMPHPVASQAPPGPAALAAARALFFPSLTLRLVVSRRGSRATGRSSLPHGRPTIRHPQQGRARIIPPASTRGEASTLT